MHISGISHGYLRKLSGISTTSKANLRHFVGKFQAYSNRQPMGKFQTNFRQILDIILAYLTHILGVNSRHISEKYQQNLGYILGIFHENLRQMSSISQVFKYVYVKSSLFSITSLFQSCTCFFWIAMNKFELNRLLWCQSNVRFWRNCDSPTEDDECPPPRVRY